MPRRRTLLLGLLASITTPQWLVAQTNSEVPRVALVLNGSLETHSAYYNAFLSGLAALGYSTHSNKNIVVDVRWAEGRLERLPAIIADLLRGRPDVMVMAGSQALHAARAATTRVPIVMATVADPVEQGLIARLENPGGNITGVAVKSVALMSDSLQLMVEAVPGALPVAVLVNPSNPFHARAWQQTQELAARLSVRVQRYDASDLGKLERALGSIARQRPRALVAGGDALYNSFRRRIAQFTAKQGLPAVQSFRGFVEAGGLMSYSPDIANNHRVATTYVDRILRGELPHGMAVMQSDTYELAINARTLRVLGITLPTSLIARVDAFID